MIIPYNGLEQHLKKQSAAVYCVTGLEPYLFNQAVLWIKQAWRVQHQDANEETILSIHNPSDWAQGIQHANSYSLFASHTLVDLRYDKKTIDASGKAELQRYLDQINPRSLILIQAPQLPMKQLQTLALHPQFIHTHVMPLKPPAFKAFINNALKTQQIRYEAGVVELIQLYYHANLLACSQIIEQISFIHDRAQLLTCAKIVDYLKDHSDFTLYELGDAYLAAETTTAIHMIRQMAQSQGEPSLILWLIAQDLRKLIQIHQLHQPPLSFQDVCQQLKIWSQKTGLYQQASQRLPLPQLYRLLRTCQNLDEQLKSARSGSIWRELERLVLQIT